MKLKLLKPNEIKSKRYYYQLEQVGLADKINCCVSAISNAERGIGTQGVIAKITLYFNQRDEEELKELMEKKQKQEGAIR